MDETAARSEHGDIRAVLMQRQDELRDEIVKSLETAGEDRVRRLAGEVRDAGENSVAALIGDLNLAHLEGQVAELRDIEQTLVRMDRGTWGRCEDCGEDIARARLEAVPTASRCIGCQEKHEHEFEATPQPSI